MGITEIRVTAPAGTKYLSEIEEFKDDLPQNCRFNKVQCGCGGTHIALTNDKPYVLLVPTVDLILNKLEQADRYQNIQPVYADYTREDVQDALARGCTKFISTYDGLAKVVDAFGDRTKEFQLLVDEAHLLTMYDEKDFRHSAIAYLLRNYTRFRSWVFMTATPVADEAIPTEIEHLPVVTVDWEDAVPITVRAQRVGRGLDDVVRLIALKHLDGRLEGNAYFFYNSVQAITRIVKSLIESGVCGPDDVRIIAADKNDAYVKRNGHPGLSIGSTGDCANSPKKLNFLTSKAFEGCDIYDRVGVTYVIADGQKKYTRLEIHTQIPQIVNRIRNSKYRDVAHLLFTESFTKDARTKEEFLEYISEGLARETAYLERYASYSELEKQRTDVDALDTNEFLTRDDNGELILNPNAGKRMLCLWEAANQTYYTTNGDLANDSHISKVQPRSTLIDLMHDSEVIWFEAPEGKDKARLGKRPNFTKLCDDYISAWEAGDTETMEFVESYTGLIGEVRQEFGRDAVAFITANSKRASVIREALDIHRHGRSKADRIVATNRFRVGKFYPNRKAKADLQMIYDELGIRKTAKATELGEFFYVRPTKRQGVNGVLIEGVR